MNDARKNDNSEQKDSEERGNEKPGFFQVVLSTVAAAFGVQSDKNRQRDFKGGSFTTFIIAGISFTLVFVVAVVLVVKLVLSGT